MVGFYDTNYFFGAYQSALFHASNAAPTMIDYNPIEIRFDIMNWTRGVGTVGTKVPPRGRVIIRDRVAVRTVSL